VGESEWRRKAAAARRSAGAAAILEWVTTIKRKVSEIFFLFSIDSVGLFGRVRPTNMDVLTI
jgi:hypothetical protein